MFKGKASPELFLPFFDGFAEGEGVSDCFLFEGLFRGLRGFLCLDDMRMSTH